MNICLLSSTALPLVGGLEIVVCNLATALTKLGHNVYHVTPYPHQNISFSDNYDYRVIRFGFKGYGRLKLVQTTAILTIAYVVRRFKIDVISVHNVNRPGSWAYYFKKHINRKVPIIGTPHGDDVQITPIINDGVRIDPKTDMVVKRNLNSFNKITGISSSIINDLKSMGIAGEKIVSVPNGVWVKKYQKPINKNKVKSKFGIPSDSIAIISIGRNHPRKGFKYGLAAIALLRKAGIDLSFILVGRNMAGMIEHAIKLGIADCLITPGEIDSELLSQLIQVSDIYFSSSIIESFGLTTLEAMSAGLPCVVTDIPGSNDLVSSRNGILAKPSDPDSMAKGIRYLIDNPKDRLRMGKESIIKAENYNWLEVAQKYVNVYEDAISQMRNDPISIN